MVKFCKYDGGYYVLEVNVDGLRLRIAMQDADTPLSEVMQKTEIGGFCLNIQK